jgi:Flp pilus assembly protein TadG
MKTRLRSEGGAAMVEFAVILPLFLMLLMGIIEFGLLLYNKQVITNASREAARAGIVAQTPRVSFTNIEKTANSYCTQKLITFGGGKVSVKTNPVTPETLTNIQFGDPLTVTVTYPYDFLVFHHIANTFSGGSFGTVQLSAETVMRYE